MKARYVRVSTGNQKTARQEARQSNDEKIFVDIISGAIPFNERKQGKELMKAVENGKIDYVSVSSIDRLGRNLFDIISTLEFFRENKVVLKVDNLGIESMVNGEENFAFKLIISVMASISEMERLNLLERQREGIAIAKAKGVYKGREKGTVESDEDFLSKYKEVIKYLKKGFSIRNTAKICNVSITTVQKVKNKI
ncbi:Putative transposon Tn552 DNA-invertase bin3 [Chryseobacterium taklimakanense]|uniref:Putative transposon Tn552 DNA-invertase bin3 n=1 Tax=Chryseobacterium taklimakanense TaxID=536441 RepID=A0A239X4Y1_9FLAO|nr:recombinase family protein [Chryseobacterium taklimakanense]SNV41466.1 Putative transposon Tn552 DNA-invertase bin3 [Chryseobacterium taklimakanense]